MRHLTNLIYYKIKLWLYNSYQQLLCAIIKREVSNKSKHSSEVNNLLIVFTTEIGDYLLFRPYLHLLRNDPGYSKYKITLIGNKAFKDLAEYFDNKIIDEFIWIDKGKYKSYQYRKQLAKVIYDLNPETLLCPIYTRYPAMEDFICSLVQTKKKVGFLNPDLSNSSNALFTEKIVTNKIMESYKLQDYFGEFLQKKIDVQPPSIDHQAALLPTELTVNIPYAVLFPGARRDYKRWSTTKFVQLAKMLQENYHLCIIICGGPDDDKYSNELAALLRANNVEFQNFSGKTSLPEFTAILEKSKLLVTNDTSSVHLGASTNTPTVVIIHGTHYGRFCPYPPDLKKNLLAVYPPALPKNLTLAELAEFTIHRF